MSLHVVSEATLDQVRHVDFWRNLGTGLHVQDKEFLAQQTAFEWDQATLDDVRNRVRDDGYFQLPPQQWGLPIDAMANVVRELDAQGLPLPFSFLYDEFWALYWRLDKLIGALLGPGYLRLPDFWTWLVDPQRGQSGWKPHRDRSWTSLFPDKSPKSITVWIPLTHATPLNSCIYAVPANRDPTYGTPEDKEWRHQAHDVRALPAEAGSVLMWTQALLHWGSSASPRETQPRISVAFEFQSGLVDPLNHPLTRPNEIPSHDLRLVLIGKQILQYSHMYPLSHNIKDLANQLLTLTEPMPQPAGT